MEGGGDTTHLMIPTAEDVVRSVFESGSSPRMTQIQITSVLSIIRNALTRGLNPIQEDWISSSSPAYKNSEFTAPAALPADSRLYFWFLLSSSGTIDYISQAVSDLLGFKPRDLTSLSAYTLVSLRDHHIVLPILNSGPSTSMSCRMHFQTVNSEEIPFDVTFAKISTRQVINESESERSATLCVARSHFGNHGQVLIQLDPSAVIIQINNKSDTWLPTSELIGRRISEICHREHMNMLETLFQAGYESSCQISLLFGDVEAHCLVRLVKGNNNNINESNESSLSLLCTVTRLSTVNGQRAATQPADTSLPETAISQPTFVEPPPRGSNQKAPAKPKKPRKPRAKKAKPIKEPIKDALLKQLLGTNRSATETSAASTSGTVSSESEFTEPVMYQQQGSSMSAQQPMYLNNNNNNNNNNNIGTISNTMNGYPGNQCSGPGFIHPNICAPPDYPMASQVHTAPPTVAGPHHAASMMQTPPNQMSAAHSAASTPVSQQHHHAGHWPEYYHQSPVQTSTPAVHQVHFAQNAAPSQPTPTTTKGQKRKASAPAPAPSMAERATANPMNYNHHPPGYNYGQVGSDDEKKSRTVQGKKKNQKKSTISAMDINMMEDMHHNTMNNHLSPYRYSPSASSPYWTASGRPPSRSELVRMELRNSLQAKQMANQQRLPALTSPVDSNPLSETHSNTPSIGSDSLGFDMDFGVKDADGSLDADLDSVYDFNLGDGCGFQFDMENDATRCLVMKLLS